MKILRTNIVDLQFTYYALRPFKTIAGTEHTYQCYPDEADCWCVVAFVGTSELYPIIQSDKYEDAEILVINMNNKLNELKELLSAF